MLDRTLIEARPSEECGCPEELWRLGTIEVLIHLEENGEGHIFIDAGDSEIDREVPTTGINDLRNQAFAIIESLPVDGDHA